MSNNDLTPEENRTANILCIISIACELAPSMLASLLNAVSDRAETAGSLAGIISSLSGLAMIAGLAIMIYVRVKYPSNIFGKVLMILYIVLVVLFVIGAILLIFACSATMESCNCRNIPDVIGLPYRWLP